MPDIEYWLAQKYAILQQQADADTSRAGAAVTTANSAANLDATRARLLPAESKANIGLTNAQANLTTENAAQVAPLARANIGLMGAQTGLARANIGLTDAQTVTERSLGAPTLPGIAPGVSAYDSLRSRLGIGSGYRLPSLTDIQR